MTSEPVRNAFVSLTYNSADITAAVEPFLLSMKFDDTAKSEESDSIELEFEDTKDNWKNTWFPQRGAKIKATLTCVDWPEGGTLDCGSFEIDKVKHSGPPSTCRIYGLALGIRSAIRRQEQTKAWENITLRAIATEVTGNHGFELVYDSKIDPQFDRYDQREQSDIDMLLELCKRNSLGLKATNGKIAIFEEPLYDQQAPKITFRRDDHECKSYDLDAKSADFYTACEVQYLDPKQRYYINYRFNAPDSDWSQGKPPTEYVLKINKRCATRAEAEALAKSELRHQTK